MISNRSADDDNILIWPKSRSILDRFKKNKSPYILWNLLFHCIDTAVVCVVSQSNINAFKERRVISANIWLTALNSHMRIEASWQRPQESGHSGRFEDTQHTMLYLCGENTNIKESAKNTPPDTPPCANKGVGIIDNGFSVIRIPLREKARKNRG